MSSTNSSDVRRNTTEKTVYFYKTKINRFSNLYDLFNLYNSNLDRFKNETSNSFDNLKDSGLIITNSRDKSRYSFLDIISISEEKIEGVIYSLRSSAFPYLFNIFTGSKREISHTMDDTIMDQTHFIVYPNKYIIVTEYNHFGCRLEILEDIFEEVFNIRGILELSPVLDMGSAIELITKGELKGFDLKVSYPALSQIQNSLNLGFIPEFNEQFVAPENLLFNIGINDTSGLNLKDKDNFIKKLLSLVDSFKTKFTDEDGFIRSKCPLKSAKVNTKPLNSSKQLTVDLFEEKLMSKVYPVKLNVSSKYLDSDDMFKCLDFAFNEKSHLIVNNFDLEKIAITSE